MAPLMNFPFVSLSAAADNMCQEKWTNLFFEDIIYGFALL